LKSIVNVIRLDFAPSSVAVMLLCKDGAAPYYVLEPFQRDLFITTLYHFMDAARYASLIKADE